MFLRQSQKPLVFVALLFICSLSTKADDTDGIKLLWRARLPDLGTKSSPALAKDGTIYQGTFNGWMFAIAPEGKVKWKFKAGLEIKSSPAVADDGTIYFGSRDRKLYALTPAGKLKWSFTTGAWVDSSPAIGMDGTVYFGSWDKSFYALDPGGRLKWKFATSNLVTTSPALATDGTIYFGSHDRFLYALSPDGNLKWKFLTGAEVDGSPVISTDGTIYFSSTDGNLYALGPNGSELWKFHTGSYTESSPVIDADGNLFLAANKDHLSIRHDGKPRWQHPTEVAMDMSPAAAGNGQVYISMPWLAISSMGATNNWPPIWNFKMDYNLSSAPNISPDGTVFACDGTTLFAFKPANAAPPVKNAWSLWRADAQHTGRAPKLK